MAYTARKLITNSYYLSGIVSRDLQSVSGSQLSDGVDLLNALLAVKSVETTLIPYYKEYTFNAVIGQEKYFVPYLVAAELYTFNIGIVRYEGQLIKRVRYFGSSRPDNVKSLPFTGHIERVLGGSNIYLYYLPQDTYQIRIWGKFGFSDVNENTDLILAYDRSYIEYLRYALAEYICSEYNITFQPQSAKRLAELETMYINISPPDMSLQKASSFSSRGQINYGQINIGQGWTVV